MSHSAEREGGESQDASVSETGAEAPAVSSTELKVAEPKLEERLPAVVSNIAALRKQRKGAVEKLTQAAEGIGSGMDPAGSVEISSIDQRLAQLSTERTELRTRLDHRSFLLDKDISPELKQKGIEFMSGFFGGTKVEFGDIEGNRGFEVSYEAPEDTFPAGFLDENKTGKAKWFTPTIKLNLEQLGEGEALKEKLEGLFEDLRSKYNAFLDSVAQEDGVDLAKRPEWRMQDIRGEITLEKIFLSMADADRNRASGASEPFEGFFKSAKVREFVKHKVKDPESIIINWTSREEATHELQRVKDLQEAAERTLAGDPENKELQRSLELAKEERSKVQYGVLQMIHESGWRPDFMTFTTPGVNVRQENAMRKSCCSGVGPSNAAMAMGMFPGMFDCSMAANRDSHTFEAPLLANGKMFLADHGLTEAIDPNNPEELRRWAEERGFSFLNIATREEVWMRNVLDWNLSIALEKGDFDTAEAAGKLETIISPENPPAYYNLAIVTYQRLKQNLKVEGMEEENKALSQKVSGLLDKTIALKGELDNDPSPFSLKSWLNFRANNDLAAAKAFMEEALKRDKKANTLWDAADLYTEMGESQSAENYYKRAVDQFPKEAEAPFKYAMFLGDQLKKGIGDAADVIERQIQLVEQAINIAQPDSVGLSPEDLAAGLRPANAQIKGYQDKLKELNEALVKAQDGRRGIDDEETAISDDPSRTIALGDEAFDSLFFEEEEEFEDRRGGARDAEPVEREKKIMPDLRKIDDAARIIDLAVNEANRQAQKGELVNLKRLAEKQVYIQYLQSRSAVELAR